MPNYFWSPRLLRHFVLCFLTLAGASSLRAQPTPVLAGQLDEIIETALSPVGESGPGVAVYIHQTGQEAYRKIIGQANLEYGIPLAEHSVFDLASLAKQFTGLAIAKLELAGKLKLTDDVRKYLPEVPEFDGPPITLDHLLRHTSGLRDIGNLAEVGNFGESLTGESALAVIIRQQKLNFTPGSAHDYSNTGYVLLALVVERVTGQSLADWSRENIFSPLQMTDTRVNDAPDNLIANRAVAYYGQQKDYSFNQNNGMSLIGSSAVFSSLADMEKWMAFMAGDDPAVRLMMQPGRLADGSAVNYGYGLSVGQFAGQPFITHSGATPAGFRTLTALLPESGIRLVVLGSWGSLEPVQDLGLPILNLLLGQAMTKEREALAPVAAFTGTIPRETLDLYAGKYLYGGERAVTIVREGQQLSITVAGVGTSALEARSPTEFFLEGMNSVLSFEVEGEAVARVLVSEGGAADGELLPVNASEAPTFTVPTNASGHYYSYELDLVLILTEQDGALSFASGRHGTHQLLQRSANGFTSETGLFQEVNLVADDAGKINGMIINLGSRARNLHFKRL